jgi:hypothetical protein
LLADRVVETASKLAGWTKPRRICSRTELMKRRERKIGKSFWIYQLARKGGGILIMQRAADELSIDTGGILGTAQSYIMISQSVLWSRSEGYEQTGVVGRQLLK